MNRRKLARRTARARSIAAFWTLHRATERLMCAHYKSFYEVPNVMVLLTADGIIEWPGGRVISDCIQSE